MSGVTFEIDAEAVVIRAEQPLRAVSSAIVGGGLAEVRSVVNLRVPRGFHCDESERRLDDFVKRRSLARPFVGLLTGARTEQAEPVTERQDGLAVWVAVTLGLCNRSTAGRSPATAWRPTTINTIVIVDAQPEDAALVNLVITATEVKTLALAEGGVRSPDGDLITGTSTDAVVVAATGQGSRCRFGGPVSELGWLVASAVRSAMDKSVARWMRECG